MGEQSTFPLARKIARAGGLNPAKLIRASPTYPYLPPPDATMAAFRAMLLAAETYDAPPVDMSKVQAFMASLDARHRAEFAVSIRRVTRVDVLPYLTRPEVAGMIDKAVDANASLIRLLTEKSKARWADELRLIMRGEHKHVNPFDRQAVLKLFRKSYGYTDYPLRRIARDQSSKLTGQLTQIRHRQAGIKRYIWQASGDERVRETHAQLDGSVQKWDTPTGEGHPGDAIQCRCVAVPVLDEIAKT